MLGTYEGGCQNRFGRKVKSELSEYIRYGRIKISTGFDGLSQNHYKKYSFNKKCSWIIKRQGYHHIETSQLICRANQLTGFYMMATLAFDELTRALCEKRNTEVVKINQERHD